MTGDPAKRLAAFAAAPLLLVLQGCLLDIRPGGMNPPGTPVDTQSDDPVAETEIDDDFIAPDPDVPDDTGPCDITCNEAWTPACQGSNAWCVSPYQGTADCCTAFDVCQELEGAFPGFWPTAGPYEFRPPGFNMNVAPPALTIVYSGIDGFMVQVSIACFDSSGSKEDGELHDFNVVTGCGASSCSTWIKSASCSGDPVGCGSGCSYPYWCFTQ